MDQYAKEFQGTYAAERLPKQIRNCLEEISLDKVPPSNSNHQIFKQQQSFKFPQSLKSSILTAFRDTKSH